MSSVQVLNLVNENRLRVFPMPASVATGANQETSGGIDHCYGVKLVRLNAWIYAHILTHL